MATAYYSADFSRKYVQSRRYVTQWPWLLQIHVQRDLEVDKNAQFLRRIGRC